MSNYNIYCADVVEWATTYKGPKFHAILNDPPYGLGTPPDPVQMLQAWLSTGHMDVKGSGYMGAAWDSFVPQPATWRLINGLLLPGAHMLAFFGTRTYDLGTLAIRLGGFEIRDCISWTYSEGYPKHHNALKPSHEPICVARKPLEGTVANNCALHGSGSLNIEGCRVPLPEGDPLHDGVKHKPHALDTCNTGYGFKAVDRAPGLPRYPANILHDGSPEALRMLGHAAAFFYSAQQDALDEADPLFYCAKSKRRERDEGLESFPVKQFAQSSSAIAAIFRGEEYPLDPKTCGLNKVKQVRNSHPTVKPIALTTYLAKLLLPPPLPDGQPRRILVPFCGSGSEVIGCLLAGWDEVVGIEMSPEYAAIADARTKHWLRKSGKVVEPAPVIAEVQPLPVKAPSPGAQLSLF